MEPASIEETLTPETQTELLLLARIRDLKRAAWEAGATEPITYRKPPEMTLSYPSPPDTIQLRLAGYTGVQPTKDARIQVSAQGGIGPGTFWQASYMNKELIESLPTHRLADIVEKHRKEMMYKLSRFLLDERLKEGRPRV